MVGPGPVLLRDPGALAHRGVDEAVPEGLRAGTLLQRIAAAPLEVLARVGQGLPLEVGRFVHCGPFAHRPRYEVEVDAGDPLGYQPRQLGGRPAAPGAAPRARAV